MKKFIYEVSFYVETFEDDAYNDTGQNHVLNVAADTPEEAQSIAKKHIIDELKEKRKIVKIEIEEMIDLENVLK